MFKNSLSLFLLLFLMVGTATTCDAQGLFNRRKKKQKPASTTPAPQKEEGGVLQNPNGFEGFGQGEDVPEEFKEPKQTVKKTVKVDKGRWNEYFNGKKKNIPTVTLKDGTESNDSKEEDVIRTSGSMEQILYGKTFDKVVIEADRIILSTVENENVKYFYSQALTKINNQKFDEALDALNRALDIGPTDDVNKKELLQLRGNLYAETNKFRKALKDFNNVLELDDSDPVINYNIGAVNSKIGNLDDAVTAFTAAINLKPDYLLALQGRGAINTLTGKYDAAIVDYNKVLDKQLNFPPAIRARGIAKSLNGSQYEAVDDFNRALKLNPDDILLYYYRGITLYEMGKFEKARLDLSRACNNGIGQACDELEANFR